MSAFEPLTDQLVYGIEYLAGLRVSVLSDKWSVPVLDVLYAILINYAYRKALGPGHSQIGWGQGLVAVVVMGSGGGSTVAVLRGEPLGILQSNEFWAIYGLTYWLFFSNPYMYQAVDALFHVPLVEEAFTIVDGILRNMAIVQFGIHGVTQSLGPDKWMAQVICGTLTGCGGAFWIDAFRLTHHHWSFSTPQFLQAVSVDMKASFAATVFYMVTTEYALLTPAAAQAWGTVVLTLGLMHGTVTARRSSSKAVIKEKKA